MKPHAGRKAFTGLLLMAIALLAPACASDGTITSHRSASTNTAITGHTIRDIIGAM